MTYSRYTLIPIYEPGLVCYPVVFYIDVMPVILGIDPGSRVTGYGIVRLRSQNISYIDSGCIKTETKAPLPQRLMHIYEAVEKITQFYQPEHLAIEEVFVAHNPQSALKLGQARGAIIVACLQQHIPVYEYAARRVKQAITGYGNAEKQQIQYMVRQLLCLSKVPAQDAADALAVALCHGYHHKNGFCQQRATHEITSKSNVFE